MFPFLEVTAFVPLSSFNTLHKFFRCTDAKGFLNSKVKIAVALNDLDDANYFSKALGNKTVKVKSQSTSAGHQESTSQNTHFQSRALMSPAEIMQMKSSEQIILMEAHPPVKAKKYYWFKENLNSSTRWSGSVTETCCHYIFGTITKKLKYKTHYALFVSFGDALKNALNTIGDETILFFCESVL